MLHARQKQTGRIWVLHTSGRDYMRVKTCTQLPAHWLAPWRARQVKDGGTILAVYRERR